MADSVSVLRSLCLLAPLVAVFALVMTGRYTQRSRAALSLAFAWNFCTVLLVHVVATRAGWWEFASVDGTLVAMPVDVLIGWALLWGPLAVLAARRVGAPVVIAVAVFIDIATMPRLQPLLTLQPTWWIGESALVVVALVPGLFFGLFTWKRSHLYVRTMMQMVTFGLLLFVVVPVTAVTVTDAQVSLPSTPVLALAIQALLLPTLIAVTAVRELATRGDGTPFPWDPTTELISSGPYAYVANPMQFGATVIVIAGSVIVQSWQLLLCALFCVAFSEVVAERHEHEHLARRFGAPFTALRSQTRSWLPTWRPSPVIPDARLYVASTCEPCTAVGMWFLRRSPVNLTIVPAETHPEALRRIRFESNGIQASGVVAVGRALEHLHLGWALVGWALATPGFSWFAQLVSDAVGFGPRDLACNLPDGTSPRGHVPG